MALNSEVYDDLLKFSILVTHLPEGRYNQVSCVFFTSDKLIKIKNALCLILDNNETMAFIRNTELDY